MKTYYPNTGHALNPIENVKSYTACGLEFLVRNEKNGDYDVIGEVVGGDCYRLKSYAEQMISKNYVPKVVFDIGGHIGTFTKLMHTYFPDAIYICVEPNTRSFDLLRRNVPFAWCFNGACTYDEVSVLTDDKYEATGGGFMTTQEKFATDELNHKDNFIYKIGEENVESITIEQILQIVGVSSIDVLKLDCEGSEFSIMTGMPKEVAAGVTLCVGEYHTDQGPDYFKEVAKKTFPQLEFEVGGRTPIDHFHSTLAIAP